MSYQEDPFADPTPRTSEFASADSFRGRLILVEPTQVERDIPKQSTQPNGPKGDRVTATVTTVDGKGQVQIYSNKVPTGVYLDGPEHIGVWFNQDQIAAGLQTLKKDALLKMVLCRIDTLKPGTIQGQGNPWVMSPASDADKQMARDFLAGRKIAQASAPAQAKTPFG